MADDYIKISAQEYSTSSCFRPVKKLIFTERIGLLTIYIGCKLNCQKAQNMVLTGISCNC